MERSLKEMASKNFPQLAKLNISHHLAQCKENKTLLAIVNDTKLFERQLNSFQNSISIDNIIPDLNTTLRVRRLVQGMTTGLRATSGRPTGSR